MKKRDRIAKKRERMWRANDTKQRERRRQKALWTHYRPRRNMTQEEVRREQKQAIIRLLAAPNPIYKALMKKALDDSLRYGTGIVNRDDIKAALIS